MGSKAFIWREAFQWINDVFQEGFVTHYIFDSDLEHLWPDIWKVCRVRLYDGAKRTRTHQNDWTIITQNTHPRLQPNIKGNQETRKPDASRCFHEQWQHLGLWDLAGMLRHVAPLICRLAWLVRKGSISYKYQKIHFTYIHMQSHHATFWDGSSCSTCLVPLQSLIEAFGSMCGHLLNGVWSAWSVPDSAPPPSSVYASLPQSRSQLRFLQACISGLLTVIFCQEDEPHTPGASTGASTVQGAEIVVKGNFDTSLPGSTVAVPPLWSTNEGSLAEIGRPWQHFDSGESIVIRSSF